MIRVVVALALAFAIFSYTRTLSAEEPKPVRVVDPPSTSAEAPSVAPAASEDVLRRRAEHVLALIEGTLPTSVDADALFVFDATDPAWEGAGDRWVALLEAIDRALAEQAESESESKTKTKTKTKTEPEPAPEAPPSGADTLIAAYVAFFSQSTEQQLGQLDAHRSARALAERDAKHDQAQRERARRLEEKAAQIEAFLAGKADPSVDPRVWLSQSLIAEGSPALSPTRRAQLLDHLTPPSATPAAGTGKTGTEKTDNGKTGTGKTGTDKTGTDKTGTDKTGTDKTGTDKTGTDKTGTEKTGTDKTGTDKTGTGAEPSTASADPPASPTKTPPGEGGDEPAAAKPPSSASDDSAAVLLAAEARYDAAWLALARLGPGEREAIIKGRTEELAAAAAAAAVVVEEPPEPETVQADSAAAVEDADQRAALAAEEREQALASARAARSESLRVLAEERAALLSIKEAQARFAGELERRRGQVAVLHETTLEWQRKVAALTDRATTSDVTEAADAMYEPLRESLGESRNELRSLLDRIGSLGSTVPEPNDVPRATGNTDRSEVEALREELATHTDELRINETDMVWTLANAVRDDTVMMNDARLHLLELGSAQLRSAITGLGDEGFDQVRRELDQIALELRFHARAWPRMVTSQLEVARSRPLGLTFGILQLTVLLGIFVAWRRSADGFLLRMRERMLERGIDAASPNLASSILYYVRRVRSPIEWWAVALFGNWFLSDLKDFTELQLLWLVASWSLIGWTLVLLLDAVAARQTLNEVEKTSLLRLYSLRLVCFTTVAVGLVLSLTKEMVGVGAIYGWMLRFCWVLLIPVVFRLVQQWRPIIFERIDATGGRDVVSRWVATQRSGWRSYASGLVGGIYLLVFGFTRWGGRLLQGAEVTRRVLAYLFRRSVTRRSRNDEVDLVPVTPAVREALGPEHTSEVIVPVLEGIERDLVELLLHNDSAMVAVVGERGSGKSTFLRRLAGRDDLGSTVMVECQPGGVDGTFAALGDALQTSADPDEIRAALVALPSVRIFIDDVQRLVRPTIGGLADFDRFAEFTRQAGPHVDWVFGIGAPVWQYVSRARSDRMIFDRVVELEPWSDLQIGELLTARSLAAAITPSFERLAMGSTPERAALPDDIERATRGFYRMLWDSADGNPAVALEIWRNSLWLREGSAQAEVRLFREAPPGDIERLPLAALFVLRAIVQLERASIDDIVECTRLQQAEVNECVTACLTRGYAERYAGHVRISWPWYRTITRVLARQHLLGN